MWFLITYFGYVIGGFYYSFGSETYGKFLRLVGVPFETVPDYMTISLFWAIICYLFFSLGYAFFDRTAAEENQQKIYNDKTLNYKFSMLIVALFIIIGLLYWVYIAYSVADGVFDLLIKFQAFRHLVADTNLSTLPYHFYYGGVLLWLVVIVQRQDKVG